MLDDNRSRLVLTGIRQRGIVAFGRQSSAGERVLIVHNLSPQLIDVVFSPNETSFRQLVFSSITGARVLDSGVRVPGYGCVVLETAM